MSNLSKNSIVTITGGTGSFGVTMVKNLIQKDIAEIRIFSRDDVCPIYIDLIDNMSTIKKHSASRLKVCKELGGDVKSFEKVFPDFYKFTSLLS